MGCTAGSSLVCGVGGVGGGLEEGRWRLQEQPQEQKQVRGSFALLRMTGFERVCLGKTVGLTWRRYERGGESVAGMGGLGEAVGARVDAED